MRGTPAYPPVGRDGRELFLKLGFEKEKDPPLEEVDEVLDEERRAPNEGLLEGPELVPACAGRRGE